MSKRFLHASCIAALTTAVISTASVSTAAAGWGPNGKYGNPIPADSSKPTKPGGTNGSGGSKYRPIECFRAPCNTGSSKKSDDDWGGYGGKGSGRDTDGWGGGKKSGGDWGGYGGKGSGRDTDGWGGGKKSGGDWGGYGGKGSGRDTDD